MKRIVRGGIIVLLSLIFHVVSCPLQAALNAKRSTVHEDRQHKLEKQVQKYWHLSPDTAIRYADSGLVIAQETGNMHDVAFFKLLKGISYYYLGENKPAIRCFLSAVKKGDELLNNKLLANGYSMLSLGYRNLCNYDSAIYFANIALKIRLEKVKDSNDIAGSYDNLSTIYHRLGIDDQAINYTLKAADIFKKLGNKRELAYVWGNLSNLYQSISDKQKTYLYSLKTASLLKAVNDNAGLADAFDNLGQYFLRYGSLDSAKYYFHKATVLYQKQKRYDGFADVQKAMGNLFLKLDQTDKAEKSLLTAHTQFEKTGRTDDLIETDVLMAEVYIRQKRFKEALKLLDKALKMEKGLNVADLRLKIFKRYEELFEKWHKPVVALQMFHRIDKLKDSINILNLNRKVEEINTKYNTEKVLSENKKLRQEQLIEKMKARQMEYFFIAFILLAALITAVLLLLLRKRKQEALINRQKLLLTQKEDEILKSELEKAKMKKNALHQENLYNHKQLTTFTLHMMQKNLILHDVLEEVKSLEKTDAHKVKNELKNLKIQIINALSSDTDWDNFKYFFEKVNNDFFTRLKEKYPDVSMKDMKLCALIRLNMDIKEAASVLNVDPNSIRIARYRLRKKMNLKPEHSLYEVMSSL